MHTHKYIITLFPLSLRKLNSLRILKGSCECTEYELSSAELYITSFIHWLCCFVLQTKILQQVALLLAPCFFFFFQAEEEHSFTEAALHDFNPCTVYHETLNTQLTKRKLYFLKNVNLYMCRNMAFSFG